MTHTHTHTHTHTQSGISINISNPLPLWIFRKKWFCIYRAASANVCAHTHTHTNAQNKCNLRHRGIQEVLALYCGHHCLIRLSAPSTCVSCPFIRHPDPPTGLSPSASLARSLSPFYQSRSLSSPSPPLRLSA